MNNKIKSPLGILKKITSQRRDRLCVKQGDEFS
ncbi:hypothetical protein CLOBY_37070 [Clostridium saccharobutylicum]|nr:hypothetical protein CLOSC_37750 [Clostridium saccharobutylicum]OAV39528.1 hypothetical protein M945_3039 [Clostridium saccharobutylicum DSM 13864]AQS01949.1 hypothetical protein CSACC_37800 [Clostridium saccharobutylicum]AQS11551.1 hypothetical protein CLOBY_37070 [Clostridium saccharobutylicum]AQS15932.1 hypothetical protein CLOSACC_37800 [Clostridium saccharobutylicum]